jgi:hypothetical protein
MELSKIPVAGNYFENTAFINVKVSTIISLFSYLENLVFPDDPDRILYSSNDFAFRKRLKTNKVSNSSILQVQNLNFPFMNFWITDIEENISRNWKNNVQEIFGSMDYSIKKKIRISPMKMSFEATFYTDRESDLQYLMSHLMWENALETKIAPVLEIDGIQFSNIALVGYSLNYNPQYTENDWLEKNRIRTISMNFEIDTYMVKTNTENFCIPKEVLLSFATTKDLDLHDWENYDVLLRGIIDYTEEKVSF